MRHKTNMKKKDDFSCTWRAHGGNLFRFGLAQLEISEGMVCHQPVSYHTRPNGLSVVNGGVVKSHVGVDWHGGQVGVHVDKSRNGRPGLSKKDAEWCHG